MAQTPTTLEDSLFPGPNTPIWIGEDGFPYSLPPMVAILKPGLPTYSGQVAFHYADRNTWPQIVRSRELWLTDYTELLDPSEGVYGLSVIYKSITCRPGLPDILGEEKDFLLLKNWLIRGLRESRFYVCSLCSNHDDIGLWRAYSSAGGLALGIAIDSIREFAKLRHGLKVENVEYSPPKQMKMSAEISEEIISLIQHGGEEPFSDPMPLDTASRLASIVMLMKHPCYTQEQEVRIISDREINGRHYRKVRNSERVKYTKLSLEECIDVTKEKHPVFPVAISSPNGDCSQSLDLISQVEKSINSERPLCVLVNGSLIPYKWE